MRNSFAWMSSAERGGFEAPAEASGDSMGDCSFFFIGAPSADDQSDHDQDHERNDNREGNRPRPRSGVTTGRTTSSSSSTAPRMGPDTGGRHPATWIQLTMTHRNRTSEY